MEVELFDCFGETFDCSICQEPVHQGQRTLVLRICQHGFHEPCIQPWLETHTTCPNCRTENALPASAQTQEPMTEHELTMRQRELDRLYASYILIDWVLRKYSGHSNELRRHYRRIHSLLHSSSITEGITPIPVDRITLSHLAIMKNYILRRETELFRQTYPDQDHRVIHRCPRVRLLKEQYLPRLEQMFAA